MMWRKIEAAVIEVMDDWVAGTKAKREAAELQLTNETKLAQMLYEVEKMQAVGNAVTERFHRSEDRKSREAYNHHRCDRRYIHGGHAWDDGSFDFRVWCEGVEP